MENSQYSIEEIFDMAIEIERRGAKFYTDAMDRAYKPEVRDLFHALSNMEQKHQQLFAGMKQSYQADHRSISVFDPDSEMTRYVEQVARSHGWEGKSLPSMEFTGRESQEEILVAAISAEKASIDFYLGLKELVNEETKPRVEAIIQEEMRHVVKLNDYLAKAK